MSEYMDACYAKLILREAQAAPEDVAADLVNDLLHHLGSLDGSSSPRVRALASIRLLAQSLYCSPGHQAREWEAANQAANVWCQNAFHYSHTARLTVVE
jgi:hypothetical protein